MYEVFHIAATRAVVLGGVKRTCRKLFTEFATQLPELDPGSPAHVKVLGHRDRTIPGLMLDATSIDLPNYLA